MASFNTQGPHRPAHPRAAPGISYARATPWWVSKLDRLGRSLRHLVGTVTGLAERGIGFRSLQEAIDTTTLGGKLVLHVFAALVRAGSTSHRYH
jgi:Resolvase, N terminal domain